MNRITFIESYKIQDLIKAQKAPDHLVHSVFWKSHEGRFGLILDKLTWIYAVKVEDNLRKFLAFFTAFLSILTIFSELAIFTGYKINLMQYLFYEHQSFVLNQIFVLIPLVYVTFVIYEGLFSLNFAGLYAFHKRHTDSPSLLFGSM